LFSYKFKDFLDESSSKKDIDKFFTLLSETNDKFVCQNEQRETGSLPKVEKFDLATHTVYKETRYHHILENLLRKDKNIKLILLVRDPVEVINSWINAPSEFDPNWTLETQLFNGELKNLGRKENFFGLNAWAETTRLFEKLSKRYHERVFLINYSMLQSNLEQTVKYIYKFCDLSLTDTTYIFLKESSEKKVSDTYSVFRGGKKSQITLNEHFVKKSLHM
jgi:hypothetical protein